MIRRAFLAHGLMLIGFSRQPSVRYARLTAPVRIPLEAVKAPWRPVDFKAEAVAPSAAATQAHLRQGYGGQARRVLLSGALFRRAMGDGPPELSALCVTCTHEQCQVDFIAEPAKLPRTDRVVTHPVFLCACHSSIFDAADEGAWISGPAPRGLYRFRARVDGDVVAIDEVEEDALSAV
jgi:Rieske Fe-S protein